MARILVSICLTFPVTSKGIEPMPCLPVRDPWPGLAAVSWSEFVIKVSDLPHIWEIPRRNPLQTPQNRNPEITQAIEL
jgi:hypothetical protein